MKTYWFIDTFDCNCSAPKMESHLMAYARKWSHCVVTTDEMDALVEDLRATKALAMKSSRCKDVEITRTEIQESATCAHDAIVYICIGGSTITLQRVENSVELG